MHVVCINVGASSAGWGISGQRGWRCRASGQRRKTREHRLCVHVVRCNVGVWVSATCEESSSGASSSRGRLLLLPSLLVDASCRQHYHRHTTYTGTTSVAATTQPQTHTRTRATHLSEEAGSIAEGEECRNAILVHTTSLSAQTTACHPRPTPRGIRVGSLCGHHPHKHGLYSKTPHQPIDIHADPPPARAPAGARA